ncbi:hypothetical protein EDB83DRAFT_2348892 [Lactarius deliciosus]|nr:hypothetical protein EDB83DRAFT_2348892 [Lactarius deliciosus]
MDNNQLNPHNSSNGAMNNVLQDGLTPEQYAQNARQLEAYSRMNALGLQVYLERQTHLAEQRRQDEVRLIQMAQQLAAGRQQHHQRQFLPAAPQVPRAHQPLPAQQSAASSSRNAPLQMFNHGRSHNEPNAGDVMSQSARQYRFHVMEPSRAPVPSVQQQQQQHPSFNTFTPFVNQNIHPQRDSNHIRSFGGVGAMATSASTHPPIAQPPKTTTLASVQHQSQYPQYSGVSVTASQARAGEGSTSRVAPSQGHSYEQISTLYHSWVKTHGPEKAAEMTQDLMRSWQQKRQIQSEVQAPMHSATASTAFAPARNHQMQSQFQIPNHSVPNEGEWTSGISEDGRLVPSQPHLAPQTSAPQGIVSPQELPVSGAIKKETDHSTTTNSPSTFPTAPSSQSHSILLAPEEKSTALYTMRGLAASIKRSLNAERLAASGQPTPASEIHTNTSKLSPPNEVVDTAEQSGLATAGTHEPAIIPTTDAMETVPVPHLDEGGASSATALSPFPQLPVSQRETSSSPDEVTIPEPSHDFVPFSTLAGAVSFDNITGYAPADHPTMPSPLATPFEGLTDPQQAPDIIPHDPMDIPLLPFTESSFNGLSFPTRTPTPPLSAMITPFRDDDVADGKIQEIPSPVPTSPCLDQVEKQPESISPTSKHSLEARVISTGGDQDRIDFDVTSPSSEHATHPQVQVQIPNSPKEESHVFVRRTEEISGEPLEGARTEGYPGDETRKHVRTSEVPSAPPMKPAGEPAFYIAVPPLPEWVRRAKRRKVANNGLGSEETEYAENELANRLCPRHCHWSGCQAVLNSMYTLKQHVRRHQSEVEPIGPAMTVSCQWKQCRMVCEQSSLLLHLNRHIDKEITCIYDDCEERFSRAQDLAAHERSEHANDESPPCAIPQRPVLKNHVPLPQTLPSYTVTTRPASKPSISAERHSRLGPWVAELLIFTVLGMTFGHPVTGSHGETRLTDKALEVAPTPIIPGNGNGGEITPKSELMEQLAEYDLLEEPSVRSFDDLNTVDITRAFRDGVSVGSGFSSTLKEVASESDGGQTSLQTVADSDSMAVEALL